MTPENWIITTLGEIGTWSSGGTPSRKNSSYYGGDIPWVKTGDLNDSLIHNTPENITKEGLRNSSAKIFPPETLLIAMYGATIGKLGILSIEASTNQACGALLPGGETRHLIPFVFYYLLSERENIRANAKGGAQPNISQTVLKSYPFSLPPLQEQSRITSKIESLQSRSTKARKALEAIPPLLENFRKSVLSSAFRGDLTADWRAHNPDIEPAEKLLERIRKERRIRWEEDELAKMKAKGKTPKDDKWKKKYKEPDPVDTTDLPELPEGWCWATIDTIAFVTKLAGFEYTKYVTYDPSGDLPVIKAENAGKYGFRETEFSFVQSESVTHLTRSFLKGGEVLMTFVGAGVGQVAMVPDGQQYFLGPNIAMIRNESFFVLPRYIELFLRSPLGFGLAMSFVKAVAQPSLSMKTIRKIPIAIPPIKEQKVIDSNLSQCNDIIEEVESIITTLKEKHFTLDQSILSKAFRGELVPQDPKDEPASQLLKRIKQEKATMEAGKKRTVKVSRKKGT